MPEKSIYRAKVAMRVKRKDGVYVNLSPGDDIPPGVVEKWNNPGLWAKRGHIERVDGGVIDTHTKNPYTPPRPSTDADMRRALEGPGEGSMFPKAGPGDIGPGKDKLPAINDPSDREMDQDVGEAKPIDPKLLEEMASRSRKELLALAEKEGLRLNGSESKADIASALIRK